MKKKLFACVVFLVLLLAGCATAPIKGNVTRDGEKIAHHEGCICYERVLLDPEEGDRLFHSVEEAEKAGFRLAYNCW